MCKIRIARGTCLAVQLVVIWIAGGLAARADGFTVVGPGGGGAMYRPTISPHDTQEVLVACDMTGAYITHDGGHSWRMFNLRDGVHFFVFDPVDRHTIYAGTKALWRSIDDGTSWNLVWPKPSMVRSVEMRSDHAEESFVTHGDELGEITALVIDPTDSHTLFASATKGDRAALFTSNDDGKSWEHLKDLPDIPLKLWIDPDSDKNSRDLYIAGKHGVEVRILGNWHNRPAPQGTAFTDISAGFSGTQRHGMMLYATSAAGVFLSHDGGASWVSSALPGKGATVRAIATSLHHPEIAYVSYSNLNSANWIASLNRTNWLGVAKTIDSGRTWNLVWKEDVTPASNVHDAWITAQMGTDWGENPLELGVADQDPGLCFGTDLGRTMVTTDGGATWTAAYSAKAGSGWSTTGLDVTTGYGYLFDPFDRSRRFIPMTDIGLFRSADDGRSWIRSMDGVPAKWSNTMYWIAFDPSVRGKMWGVMSGTHDLPRPKMWRHNSPMHYEGGVCLSLDGGKTWSVSNSGMPETAPTHILVDPTSPAGKRTLWVSSMGRGVFKSSDDGRTWSARNSGISQHEPLAWRLTRAGDGTLYVLLARRSEDGSIANSGDGAIYRSTDGANSWTPVAMPSGVNAPNGIAIDPKDSNRLYLAAWARAAGEHGKGGGVFVSSNGGKSWKATLSRDQHVYDITIDPNDARTLYATGFESSAWRSVDRGEHWMRIAGFNFKWAHRISPDLKYPKMIYISTFGGGVWHGPALGGSERPDIATPGLKPNNSGGASR